MTLLERIEELERTYGSLSNVAFCLNIDKAYLSRLKAGTKDNPSTEVLRKLGLKRTVDYILIKEL